MNIKICFKMFHSKHFCHFEGLFLKKCRFHRTTSFSSFWSNFCSIYAEMQVSSHYQVFQLFQFFLVYQEKLVLLFFHPKEDPPPEDSFSWFFNPLRLVQDSPNRNPPRGLSSQGPTSSRCYRIIIFKKSYPLFYRGPASIDWDGLGVGGFSALMDLYGEKPARTALFEKSHFC